MSIYMSKEDRENIPPVLIQNIGLCKYTRRFTQDGLRNGCASVFSTHSSNEMTSGVVYSR